MGFVSGGGNICHRNCSTPIIFCVFYFKHEIVAEYHTEIVFFSLIFDAFLRLRFLDVEINHDRWRPVPAVCRILCSNVLGMAGNHSNLIVASFQHDILLCSETLISDMHHQSELLVPGFGRLVLLCRGKLPRARGMAAYVRDGYGAY